MKKLTALFLAIICCISLTGCKKQSREAFDTDVMIKAIGTVTQESGEDIATAERFYNKLTREQKEEVELYDTLVKARRQYNRMILYGQWCQFTTDKSDTFVLNEDGTFQLADGTSGTFVTQDSKVILTASGGEEIVFEKVMEKNLLHLVNDTSDYIRPDLLVTERSIMLDSNWFTFFKIQHHVHIDKELLGLAHDWWNCYMVVPNDKYQDYVDNIAPGTDVTITFRYTSRELATMHNIEENSIVGVEELTGPVEKEVTLHLTGEDFESNGLCCGAGNEIVHGGTSKYKNFTLVKTLEYLENIEVISFSGDVYTYPQLMDY